jgi:electron transfer flavoprotein beta subunit
MRILTPLKRVVDPYAKVRALADGSGIDTSGLKFEINPFDEIALEEAVRMKERGEATEIVAVTVGPAVAEEQLRKALAFGADSAILVETEDELDPSVVAAELAALTIDLNPNLVLMGKQATDDDCNQVGQRLAAKLGWPQATFASSIARDAEHLSVTRETDDGTETVRCPLPCVVTVDLRLNEPRYIGLPGIIKARSKPLERRSRATSVQAKVRVVRTDNPPARSAGKRVSSVDELIGEIVKAGVL